MKEVSAPMATVIPRAVRIPWLAERLGLSRKLLWQLARSGQLRCVRVGRAVLVMERDVLEFLERQREGRE